MLFTLFDSFLFFLLLIFVVTDLDGSFKGLLLNCTLSKVYYLRRIVLFVLCKLLLKDMIILSGLVTIIEVVFDNL